MNRKTLITGIIFIALGLVLYYSIQVPKSKPSSEVGAIWGTVNIGPICPVEREGVPCPVPPEAYTSRMLIIYESDGKTERMIFPLNPDGTYGASLPAGDYVLNMARLGIDSSSELPHRFTIIPGETIGFDFSIDTGIR